MSELIVRFVRHSALPAVPVVSFYEYYLMLGYPPKLAARYAAEHEANGGQSRVFVVEAEL